MSISKLHTIYAVHLNTATLAASPVLFDQIQSFSISTGLQRVVQRGDGAVDPTYVAIKSQRPMIRFGTSAIATALAACGIGGAVIDADATYPGLVAWFQKLQEGGVRASGSSHLKLTGAKGQLVPRTLRASQDGVAMIDYEAVFTYDGTLDPIVIADSQALAGSPAVGELFTVGPVSINGTVLEGIQDITIDFGLQVITMAGDGQVWPTYSSVMSRDPTIRIRTTDVVSMDTFGLSGVAQGATDSVVYFRKMADGGTRTADATAEHVSVTVDKGIVTVEDQDGSQDAVSGSTVMITPTSDGTNAIVAVSTAAALP